MKRVALTFTKEFTRGTLAKTTRQEVMHFPSLAHACQWVEGVNRKDLEYKVTSFRARGI